MSTGLTQLSMPIFEDLAETRLDTPMSFSGAFPVPRFLSQVAVLAWKVNILVYGGNSTDLLARLDPAQFSWRMLQQSLLMGEGEQKLLRRLPDWGTAHNGALYRLLMQALPTAEIDGSAWPTANAEDYHHRKTPQTEKVHVTSSGTLKLDTGHKSQIRLSETVKYYESRENWHTPIANDALKSGDIELKPENGLSAQVLWSTPRARDHQPESLNSAAKRHTPNLPSQVSWATPQARDHKGITGKNWQQETLPNQVWATPKARDMRQSSKADEERDSLNLNTQVSVTASEKNNGQLNPAWVEILQGFPQGWTEID